MEHMGMNGDFSGGWKFSEEPGDFFRGLKNNKQGDVMILWWFDGGLRNKSHDF